MPVGYLPDTFGHPSQMPEILAGFGMDSAVIYRGVRTDRSEFLWEAPDGTRVLTVYLPGGYCNCISLSSSPERFLEEQLPSLVEKLRQHATTSNILLMNGCDHAMPRPDLADTVAEANRRLGGAVQLRQGTLAEYIGLVRQAGPELAVLRGEFRSGRPGRITPGVVSSRMYLKLENFRTYRLLERGAEPLSALAWLVGGEYPKALLWCAWRQFLQNQPHDSICGCSTDRVHRDMLARYTAAQDVAEELVYRAARALAGWVGANAAGEAGRSSPEGAAGLVAFNPLPIPRREVVRQKLHFLERGKEFHLLDADRRAVPFHVVGRRPMQIDFEARTGRFEREGKLYPVVLAEDMRRQAEIVRAGRWQRWQGEEVEVVFLADLPPAGYARLDAAGVGSKVETDLGFGEDWAENAYLWTRVYPDGSFDLRTSAPEPCSVGLESWSPVGTGETSTPTVHQRMTSW